MPVHYDTKHPWAILFQINGSIWLSVLPYCILNCCLTYAVYLLKTNDIKLTFSASGHALMSLLVSYLVVSKVYLSLDRYMQARTFSGQTLMALRELNQLVLTFTFAIPSDIVDSTTVQKWRNKANERIVELLHCTIRVLRREEMAAHLARDEQNSEKLVTFEDDHDPMVHVQLLRSHLYSPDYLQLLERMKLLDHLNLFVAGYREVLKLASTPLPFTMIQMGRTFLFLWTFSLPFALVGVIGEFVSGILSVLLFVFFLTYGFIGLEFVSMQLLHPFGDGVNDIGIEGMGRAIVRGIDKDTDNLKAVFDSLPPRSPRNASGTASSTRHLDKNQQYPSEAALALSKDSTDYSYHTSYHTCPA